MLTAAASQVLFVDVVARERKETHSEGVKKLGKRWMREGGLCSLL